MIGSTMKRVQSESTSKTGHAIQQYKKSLPSFLFVSVPNSFAQSKWACACGGNCPRCLENDTIQSKLKIGSPNDKYEQEADQVADQVMRMPEPNIQRQPGEDEEELLQTKSYVGQTLQLSHNTDVKIQGLRGGGQALDSPTREFMEARFGRDFNKVRIHTGNHAADLAKSINARAFTFGRDVVMGAGEYSSASGRKLLAHELTHVVQQNGGRVVRHKRAVPSLLPVQISRGLLRKVQRSRALFISTHGSRGYMRWGARFHREHGYPAAQQVGSVEEMLEHMAQMQRPIQQVRILTHAAPQGIFLPLLRGGGTTLYQRDFTLSRRFELQQELGTSHSTVRRGRRHVVINANHHQMPQSWVSHTWQYLFNNSTRTNRQLLTRIGLTRRPNAMTEMHNFFWWVIDREVLQIREPRRCRGRIQMVHVIPMNQRRRRQLITSYGQNVAYFRNRAIAGPYSGGIPLDVARIAPPVAKAPMSAAQARQMESTIAAGARHVFSQRRSTLRSTSYGLPNQRYRSVQAALVRGTYPRNLLRVKYLIPNGAALEIRGCRIGQNRTWLESFRDFFGHGQGTSRSRPHVSAPRLRHIYRRRSRLIGRGRRRRRQYFPVTEGMELRVRGRVRVIGPKDPRFAANIVHVR